MDKTVWRVVTGKGQLTQSYPGCRFEYADVSADPSAEEVYDVVVYDESDDMERFIVAIEQRFEMEPDIISYRRIDG